MRDKFDIMLGENVHGKSMRVIFWWGEICDTPLALLSHCHKAGAEAQLYCPSATILLTEMTHARDPFFMGCPLKAVARQ